MVKVIPVHEVTFLLDLPGPSRGQGLRWWRLALQRESGRLLPCVGVFGHCMQWLGASTTCAQAVDPVLQPSFPSLRVSSSSRGRSAGFRIWHMQTPRSFVQSPGSARVSLQSCSSLLKRAVLWVFHASSTSAEFSKPASFPPPPLAPLFMVPLAALSLHLSPLSR